MIPARSAVTQQARRWTTGIFFSLVIGFLLITACSATGDAAFERVMLTTMIGVFVVGGATLGLLISQQISGTHLTDDAVEIAQSAPPESESQHSAPVRRGFLGMFDPPPETLKATLRDSDGPHETRPQRRAA